MKTNAFSFLLIQLAKTPNASYSVGTLANKLAALPNAAAALNNGAAPADEETQKKNLAALLSTDLRLGVEGDKITIKPVRSLPLSC